MSHGIHSFGGHAERSRRFCRRTLLSVAVAACFASSAHALPSGANVANGTVLFDQMGNTLTVTNSNRAIINWQSFSIAGNETVRFVQPSATSSVLNRVVTADPSVLLGALQSNGRVYLINPAGILVGAGARIDVAAFMGSTLGISNEDFLAGRLNLVGAPGAGSVKVENGAEIKSVSGGHVYLIAPQVENNGLISTPQGEVILAAGNTVELIDSGTPGVRVAVTAGGNAINVGQLVAESGRVGMVGAVVRQQGTANASSLVSEGGRIFLKATQKAELAASSSTAASGTKGGKVEVDGGEMTLVSGRIEATGSAATGGRVELLGDKVGVLDGARVDASGSTGGGTILVGGDYQGKNPEVRNAQISYLASNASLTADAATNGDGGKVIVWADDTTRGYGRISARGGINGGNGGFVEVSGKKSLDFKAQVDTFAPKGKTGTLLLDPFSVTIFDGPGTSIGGSSWTESSGATNLQWSSIDTQLGLTNVTITTSDSGGAGDNIVFSNAYGPMTASASSTNKLILNANDKIIFNQSLDLKGGLDATAGTDIDVNAKVRAASSMNVSAGGNIKVGYNGLVGEAGLEMAMAGGAQQITAGNQLILEGTYNASSPVYIKSSGSQDITANSISLTAGTSFSGNSASIEAAGAQTITTTAGNLTLAGSTNAEARIKSTTSQDLNISGNLSLTGGAGASAGGAIITAPTQDISVGGTLTLTAGTGSTVDAYGMAAPAAIGYEGDSDITINVGSSVSLTGSNSINPAVIGSAVGTSTVYLRGTDINLGNYSLIGNNDGSSGGSATLIATGTAIQQLANGRIITGTVDATANTDVALDGINRVGDVSLTATGGFVSYHTANTANTRVSADATGNITITGDAGSTSIELGNLTTTGTSTISVTAQKAILEDTTNGSLLSTGSGNITLASVSGTAVAGELAISANVETTGNVNATVNGGPYGSIGIRDYGASQPANVLLNASSATAEGALSYYRYGDLSLANISMSQYGTDGVAIGASGNVSVPSGFLFGAGSSSAVLSAGGNLTLNGGNLTMRASDNTIIAGGQLRVDSGKTLTADPNMPLDVYAGSVYLNGGTPKADNADLMLVTPGNVDIAGGGLLQSVGKTLTFLADNMNVYQGSVSAAKIDGTLFGNLVLGTPSSTGYMNATNGMVDLAIGGTGIEIYNGSYINSTDATQPAGGLVRIFFSALSDGGSFVDDLMTFDNAFKVSGTFTTLGNGLEVSYGLLNNPVANAINSATQSATSTANGTSETTTSLTLVTGSTDPNTGAPLPPGGTTPTGTPAESFDNLDPNSSGTPSTGTNTSKGKTNAKPRVQQCTAAG